MSRRVRLNEDELRAYEQHRYNCLRLRRWWRENKLVAKYARIAGIPIPEARQRLNEEEQRRQQRQQPKRRERLDEECFA